MSRTRFHGKRSSCAARPALLFGEVGRARRPDDRTAWLVQHRLDLRTTPITGPSRFVRYFFHVTGTRWSIQDDQGTPFPDAAEAVALAETMADELAQDEGQYHGHVIVVVDEQETVIARIPIIRRTN